MVTGRRALITGASRGIGAALAGGLAERGWDVGLLARDETALAEVAQRCRAAGVRAVVAAADVVDAGQVQAAVARVAGELGGVDLLVNNAGVIEPTDEDFVAAGVARTWRVIEVNLRGPMTVTHAVLGVMMPGGGRVVNLNSGAGHKAMSGYTGYAVSKGALARFTTQLDAQFRERGVYAFDVAPGHVETDMTRDMPMHAGRTDWTPPSAVVDLVAGIGEGRLDGLSGRFIRAGADTVESLLEQQAQITQADARRLRLVPATPGDPVA